MLKEERFNIILKSLEKDGKGSYETLASLLAVSEDTVRRDIDFLYRNGLLTKVRGGAMVRSKDPLSFQERTSFATEAKDVIGLKAQSFIKNGLTIFMDGSTTVDAVAKHFPLDISLKVVTNHPRLASILTKFKHIELILLGGLYHPETETTMGADTCMDATKYIADIYFMGNCAIDSKLGSSATFKVDADVKKAMIKSSKKVIALADQNKLRRTETYKVIDVSGIDVLITDLPSDDSQLDEFRSQGLRLV